MSISEKIDNLHLEIRRNKWLFRFTLFTRIALAAGFIPSGMQKVLGERFTVLAVKHPMGHYLDAVYETGFYYTFIGIMQVTAAILLLIPRTATIGVIIYLPIILNICILSLATRFDGSLITSPLMTLACIYLIFWDYHKFKFILPFKNSPQPSILPTKNEMSNRFPFTSFGLIFILGATVVFLTRLYKVMPRNTIEECYEDCKTNDNPEACIEFCKSVHEEGNSLEKSLKEYYGK